MTAPLPRKAIRQPFGMTSTTLPSGDTQTLVIGGGVVGASIGWGLARAGQHVTLLDEGDLALRASRGNFALVWVQGKGLGLPAYAHWTRRSADLWPDLAMALAEETGMALHYSRPGGFSLCLTDRELQCRAEEMARLHNQLSPADYPYEILDHEQTRRRLPAIGGTVAGALFSPLDGHVNALKLFHALHIAFQARGGRYLPGHRVETIAPHGAGFQVVGPWGRIKAERLVLAAGLDNARLAPMAGLHAPVAANRGHILVTEKTAPFLHHPIVNIRQTNEGGVMIGDSHEDHVGDTRLRRQIVSQIAERAIRLFPCLSHLQIVRTWSALRVMSPDGFPIYDQSDLYPGAFLACCHSGITLAAAHALDLAPAIANGRLPFATGSPFSGRRFHVQTAA